MGHVSVYIHTNILVLHLSANHKAGSSAKPVDELDPTMLSEVSSLPSVSNAVQKLLCVLGRNRWAFNRLLLTVNDDDRRLADVQPQPVRSIGMNKVKKVVHGVHALEVAYKCVWDEVAGTKTIAVRCACMLAMRRRIPLEHHMQ